MEPPGLPSIGKPADPEGLHLALKECPFITRRLGLIFAQLKIAPVEMLSQTTDSHQVAKGLPGYLQAPLLL